MQINYFNAVMKGDSLQTKVQMFLLDIKIQHCATNVIKMVAEVVCSSLVLCGDWGDQFICNELVKNRIG